MSKSKNAKMNKKIKKEKKRFKTYFEMKAPGWDKVPNESIMEQIKEWTSKLSTPTPFRILAAYEPIKSHSYLSSLYYALDLPLIYNINRIIVPDDELNQYVCTTCLRLVSTPAEFCSNPCHDLKGEH